MEMIDTANLVWFGSSSLSWGRSWIEELFKRSRVVYHYPQLQGDIDLLDRCIVVTNNSESYDYIRDLDRAGKKHAVVLLSDEMLVEPMFYLKSPNCIYAARNYFNPQYWNESKVFTFGLGHRHKFEEHVTPNVLATVRRRLWSFAGSLKADREEAIEHFKNIKPYQLNVLPSFNDVKQLTVQEYADLLSDSVFCLAPRGGANLDSFRIYEALEAGSIPVVLKSTEYQKVSPSYWHAVFIDAQKLPFVCSSTWEEAYVECKKIIDSGRINEVQEECKLFWESYKLKWSMMFDVRTKQLINA